MIVKDVLAQCTAEELHALLPEDSLEGLRNALAVCADTQPVSSPEYIMVGVNLLVPEALLFRREVVTGFTPSPVMESMLGKESYTEDDFEVIVHESGFEYESYSYYLDDWATVLGYEVDETSLETVGLLPFAAAVISELTFFDYGPERVKEEAAILAERAEEINNLTEEEISERFLSLSDVVDQLVEDGVMTREEVDNELDEAADSVAETIAEERRMAARNICAVYEAVKASRLTTSVEGEENV